MTTEWTVERLGALPEGTLIEVSGDDWYAKDGDSWHLVGGSLCVDSTEIALIRVVSVPIDALLTDEAVEAARWRSGLGSTRYGIERMLRAAIGHATGESV